MLGAHVLILVCFPVHTVTLLKGSRNFATKSWQISGEQMGEWLFAIPLLHFLRGDSNPFEEPDIVGSYTKLEWIGAQKLRIKEFQKSEKQ